MKKSVILMITVIYIFAIVAVGFLGLKMKVSNPQQYVNEIICLSEGYEPYDKTSQEYLEKKIDGKIEVKYTEGLVVELKFQVKPDNATYNRLTYPKSTDDYIIEVKSDGTASITFLKKCAPILTIRASDNDKVKITVQIFALGDGSDII